MKIYVTGGENIGWALDTDSRLAKDALSKNHKIVKWSIFAECIHSVSPNTTYMKYVNSKKPFISVFQGEPKRLFNSDTNFKEFCIDNVCVAQTRQAYKQLIEYGCRNVHYIPYIADVDNFFYIEDKMALRAKYGIEKDKYVICNFMRDSLGSSLNSPKLEKGPDLFLEIVEQVTKEVGKDNLIILLAGPRRHWLRKKLSEKDIPYMYIGKITEDDDMKVNIQSSYVVNELLNCSDLLVVTSRTEGGPRGIMEAALAKVPVISTDVGIARDIMDAKVIFKNIDEAVQLIKEDFYTKNLLEYVDGNRKQVLMQHSVENVAQLWKSFYSMFENSEH